MSSVFKDNLAPSLKRTPPPQASHASRLSRQGPPDLPGAGSDPEGPVEIQLVSDFQSLRPSLTDFTTVISDFNKTTKQKIGPAAATVIVTSSGITAQEPKQNPVIVFSITLTQKRVRPSVWIILVLHAELASVRALLVKGLYHSNLPSTLELVCNVPSLLHAHTKTKFRKFQSLPAHTHRQTERERVCVRACVWDKASMRVRMEAMMSPNGDFRSLLCRFKSNKSARGFK
jgi:hypothetical protein